MVSKGRQRERDLMAFPRAKQGPVVYVEGGAKGELAVKARRAFGKLFEQLRLPMRPRVFACGGRTATFERFVEHLASRSDDVVLLVDSEEVRRLGPWAHVKHRDGWSRPSAAKDSDLCFMAVVMETWCLAELDRSGVHLEEVAKTDVYDRLERATKGKWDSRQKAASFDWLEQVSAQRLRQRCSEFDRAAKRLGAS